MMNHANRLVIVCVLLLLSLIILQSWQSYEGYVVSNNQLVPQKNETPDAWNRHSIQDSLPLDYVVKYENAYYNELDNRTFIEGLYRAFQPNSLLMNGSDWINQIQVDKEHIPPKLLQDQYRTIVPWIEQGLNANAGEYFRIPGDASAPFQIIHDHWNSWSKNIMVPNRFLYNMDVVVYRESKYHAKHLRFIIVADKQGIVGVVSIRMVGIIFEDKFGLFPVVQSDMVDLELSKTAPYNEAPSITDASMIEAEAKRRAEQNAINEKIRLILEKSPP